MVPIIMPQVGQDYSVGVIVEWLKNENDPVEKGQAVLTVESEKATFEVEADESGVLLKKLYNAGQEVEILKPVGYIGQPGEVFEERPNADTEPKIIEPERVEEKQQQANEVTEELVRLRISPSARKAAKEYDVDLTKIKGTGPNNRITKEDVMTVVHARISENKTDSGE